MIYRAIQLIQIFLAHKQADERTNEGVPRGPRGPENITHVVPMCNFDISCICVFVFLCIYHTMFIIITARWARHPPALSHTICSTIAARHSYGTGDERGWKPNIFPMDGWKPTIFPISSLSYVLLEFTFQLHLNKLLPPPLVSVTEHGICSSGAMESCVLIIAT